MANRITAAESTTQMKSLILADIHGNLAALEAVLEREKHRDEIIFLGDVCEAGPNVNEVLSVLSTFKGVFIMGNHDRRILNDSSMPDRQLMANYNLDFLSSFQETCVMGTHGFTMRLTHGVLPQEWGGRLWPDSSPEIFSALVKKFPEPYVLFGHSHVQFRKTHDGTHFINPGSVGAPYLGQPLACYGVLQDGRIELKATAYDVEKTCLAMDQLAVQGIKDEKEVETWKKAWRTGTLPEGCYIRDYTPLIERGYR